MYIFIQYQSKVWTHVIHRFIYNFFIFIIFYIVKQHQIYSNYEINNTHGTHMGLYTKQKALKTNHATYFRFFKIGSVSLDVSFALCYIILASYMR